MFGKNKKNMKRKNVEAGMDMSDNVEGCSTKKTNCGHCCGKGKQVNRVKK